MLRRPMPGVKRYEESEQSRHHRHSGKSRSDGLSTKPPETEHYRQPHAYPLCHCDPVLDTGGVNLMSAAMAAPSRLTQQKVATAGTGSHRPPAAGVGWPATVGTHGMICRIVGMALPVYIVNYRAWHNPRWARQVVPCSIPKSVWALGKLPPRHGPDMPSPQSVWALGKLPLTQLSNIFLQLATNCPSTWRPAPRPR